MSRVDLVDPASISDSRKPILDEITAAFGVVPAMFRAAANSPAALQMMWAGFGALGTGTLGSKLGEQVAVLVADQNACEYCLAAHTVLGRKAGASGHEMSEAQSGRSTDPATAAALRFAAKMVIDRARIGDGDIQALRDVGFGDEQIVELVAHVALNIFTNYINVALDVPIDFPRVELLRAA